MRPASTSAMIRVKPGDWMAVVTKVPAGERKLDSIQLHPVDRGYRVWVPGERGDS